MKSPRKQPKVKLEVRATLELDGADFQRIDEFPLDRWVSIVDEIKSATAPVKFHKCGLIHGVIRFTVPSGYELKVARLISLGEPVERTPRGGFPEEPPAD